MKQSRKRQAVVIRKRTAFVIDDVGRPEINPVVTGDVVVNVAIINHDTAELIAKIKQLFEERKRDD